MMPLSTADVRDAKLPRTVLRALPFPLGVLAALPPVACRISTGEGSVYTSSVIVYGRVVGPDGRPVGGARVLVRVYSDECEASPRVAGGGPRLTDSSGYYRQLVQGAIGPFTACAAVIVQPPTSAGLRDETVSGLRLTLNSDYPRPRRDSAVVNVTLTARP